MNRLALSPASAASPIRLDSEVTSAYFRKRAKHYRYAAVMNDDSQKRQMLRDLAFMFEQMSHGFTRFETRNDARVP